MWIKCYGAQDCGTAIALFATQAVESCQEYRVVSLILKVLLIIFGRMLVTAS